MARKALGPAAQEVVGAIDRAVDAPMLVACSGGADSTALALGAAVVGDRRGLGVRALIVDHGLQDGSAEVAQATVGRLGARGIVAGVVRVQVTVAGDGVEAAARRARQEALAAARRDDECLLLGHTLDDQAETVLLGLARGSGARSLAGMRPRSGAVVRPLLGLRATTTRQACCEWGVEWWDDPHNGDVQFARVRVRNTVLPVLEAQLGPGVAQALARCADLIRDDADLLDAQAGEALASQGPLDSIVTSPDATANDAPSPQALDASWLARLPPALRTRVLRDWLRALGSDPMAIHIRAVDALVTRWHGQRWVDVPGLQIARRDNRLVSRQGCL